MSLGLCLTLLWQCTWVIATMCAITNSLCESDNFGKWLFIWGVSNFIANFIFLMIIKIYYGNQKLRNLLIFNTGFFVIWYSSNWVVFGIGIDLFTKSACAQNNEMLHDRTIVLFVYLGNLLLLTGLGLFYGIYSGRCDKRTFG